MHAAEVPVSVGAILKVSGEAAGSLLCGLFAVACSIGAVELVRETVVKKNVSLANKAIVSATWVTLGSGLSVACGYASYRLYNAAREDIARMQQKDLPKTPPPAAREIEGLQRANALAPHSKNDIVGVVQNSNPSSGQPAVPKAFLFRR